MWGQTLAEFNLISWWPIAAFCSIIAHICWTQFADQNLLNKGNCPDPLQKRTSRQLPGALETFISVASSWKTKQLKATQLRFKRVAKHMWMLQKSVATVKDAALARSTSRAASASSPALLAARKASTSSMSSAVAWIERESFIRLDQTIVSTSVVGRKAKTHECVHEA